MYPLKTQVCAFPSCQFVCDVTWKTANQLSNVSKSFSLWRAFGACALHACQAVSLLCSL